jgi:transposase
MKRSQWSWIVPAGFWEVARPSLPAVPVRPQGGGKQPAPDEAVFAAVVYVLVSGCAWRSLPPCFGVSKSTAHRWFVNWTRAGVWDRLHRTVLDALEGCGLLDLSRVVTDSAHVRAKKGGGQTGPSPVDRGKPGSKMHVPSERRGLPLVVAVSRGNEHDSQGLKPVITTLSAVSTRVFRGHT